MNPGIIIFLLLLGVLVQNQSQATDVGGCRDQLPSRISYDMTWGAWEPDLWKSIPDEEKFRVIDQKTIDVFLQTYDHYPAALQVLMCNMATFHVVTNMLRASATSNMEFRHGLFQRPLTLEQWMTWKDQLNFGVPNPEIDDFTYDPNLAHFEVSPSLRSQSFLYFLLAHEFGHHITMREDEHSWAQVHLSQGYQTEHFTRPCTYFCEPRFQIPASKMEQVYDELFYKTNSLSLYARKNSPEDLAETFAFYVATQIDGHTIELVFPNGKRYDIGEKMKSPAFAEKLKLVKFLYDSLPTAPTIRWMRHPPLPR